jgi:biopolymer transport protein ExbB
MIEFLWTMGPFLLPLVLLSIYGVGLILKKSWMLRKAKPLGPRAMGRTLDLLAAGLPVDGIPAEHPVADLLAHASEAPNLLQARAQMHLSGLEERLSYLPALANIATLTGLFGTVCGMISAFFSLRAGGGADPGALAGGLGQALVATALGLITAIPSLTAHAIFQRQIQQIASQLEIVLAALLAREAQRDA